MDAVRCRRVCAADRMRKHRKPAAGARDFPFTGVCCARSDWSWTRADREATTCREHVAGLCWWSVGHWAGCLEFEGYQMDNLCRSAALWRNPDGRNGARVRSGAFARHGRAVRAGSFAGCFQNGSRWCAEGKRTSDQLCKLNH